MKKSSHPVSGLNEQRVIDSLRQLGFTVEKDGSKKADQHRFFSAVIGKTEERLTLE
ncbi:hypothetical protein C8P63_10620 [Melghirimyces profundicolus]|uniref:Uncharacterized protein n=1 Tax=Melghirimyces profundicolus TaxID=1242148 RepID=A0A2T6C0D1_9BACL|nr:hypothetical protein [Melghirimyces profundicolus]PTX61768.1 hypothetical protein C8P63_10620 [Melghirimyces profundicolus]